MLDINDYQLPDRPNIEDYDSEQSLQAAIKSWQNQVEKEWIRLFRDAERASRGSFSPANFNTKVRAVVLIIVVLAIVTIPIIALLEGTFLTEFGQYIAPVTGIGGVIIGYWFGQAREDSPSARRGAGGEGIGA